MVVQMFKVEKLLTQRRQLDGPKRQQVGQDLGGKLGSRDVQEGRLDAIYLRDEERQGRP